MTLLVLFALTALVFSFLCSIMEAVLLSVSPSFVVILEKSGHRSGAILRSFKKDVNRPLAAILSLNTMANTIGAAGVGAQAAATFGSAAVGIASAILTLLILVFSEIIPKTLGARYWRQLAKLFPDAPVLLSLRDTDSWCASLMHVIEEWTKELAAGGLSEERQAFFDFMEVLYREEMELKADDFKALYDAHNQSVLDHAEEDEAFKKRLVVWNTGDGWEPICAALGLPVPEIPFPHRNRRGEYHGF